MIEVDPRGGAALFPLQLVPFDIPGRPITRIEFEIEPSSGPAQMLRPSTRALRGRYDLPREMQAGELILLAPGNIYGWIYDLNGRDWELPKEKGEFRLRAKLRIALLEPGPDGRVAPAVLQRVKGNEDQIGDIVVSGTWTTEAVSIVR